MSSRIGFYLTVFAILWLGNFLVPDAAEVEARRWEALGVARPYMAVSAGEWERILIRESR